MAAQDTLREIKDFLEWLEEHTPDIFYKEPCEWQDAGDYDSRCGGHLEADVNAWICGREDECPLNWGAYGLIESMQKDIARMLE